MKDFLILIITGTFLAVAMSLLLTVEGQTIIINTLDSLR